MSVLPYRIASLARRLVWRTQDLILPVAYRRARIAKRIARTEAAIRARRAATPGQPLRVGFVVCERAKWSAGSLFKALHDDPDFDCGFFPALSDTALRMRPAARRRAYRKMRSFLRKFGPVWADFYDPALDQVQIPRNPPCDVVFYQQPWGMQELPRHMSKRVLGAHMHYGFVVLDNEGMQWQKPYFHGYLWRYYAQTQRHLDLMRASDAPGRPPEGALRLGGYPKLDTYRQPAPERENVRRWSHRRDTERPRVIYAPHHAIGDDSLGLSTFHWSGDVMEALAIAHPEIDFLLKPHPNMRYALQHNGMSDAAISAWFKGWETRPNCAVFKGGRYFKHFRTSDLLITDSGSFLAEYLPTGAPIIRMRNHGTGALNDIGKDLKEAFYQVYSPEDLRARFDQVAVRGDDPLHDLRQQKIALVLPPGPPSATVILDDLRQLIR
ncbi:hypothetical protein OO012_03745 [Rhodobacteraceae bacterium KMM 6894]|nr:hypothetical protein [Rhodobacteraceae bacterium KMM 6894]